MGPFQFRHLKVRGVLISGVFVHTVSYLRGMSLFKEHAYSGALLFLSKIQIVEQMRLHGHSVHGQTTKPNYTYCQNL